MLGKLKDPTLVILGLIANSEAEQLQEAASLVSQVFSCPHNKPMFRAAGAPLGTRVHTAHAGQPAACPLSHLQF